MSSLTEVAYALEDALHALMATAAVRGSGLQLNAPTQYVPVAIVERVVPQEQRLYPSVAAQFRNMTVTQMGIGKEDVSATYDIAVAVQQPYMASVAGTIAACRANLRPFVDDGGSNGIVPLLRTQPTLGNLCRRSKIITLEEVTLQTGSATSGAIVAAFIVFQCDYSVSIA